MNIQEVKNTVTITKKNVICFFQLFLTILEEIDGIYYE